MTIFKNENWEVKVKISNKGTMYSYLFYKGKPMGFVNYPTPEIQRLFYLDVCPELVEEAEKIRKEYLQKRYDKC